MLLLYLILYETEDLTSVTDPCALNPCVNGGTCEAHDGTFTCFCAEGFAGDHCQHDHSRKKGGQFGAASFVGSSLMALETPADSVSRLDVSHYHKFGTKNRYLPFVSIETKCKYFIYGQ